MSYQNVLSCSRAIKYSWALLGETITCGKIIVRRIGHQEVATTIHAEAKNQNNVCQQRWQSWNATKKTYNCHFFLSNSKSLTYSGNTNNTVHYSLHSLWWLLYMCKQFHLESASLYRPMISDDSHVVFPLKAAFFVLPAGTCISVAERANREMVVFGISHGS